MEFRGQDTQMNKIKLTKSEQRIENALLHGEYRPTPQVEFSRIADAIKRRRKDAVLNIRVNSDDLRSIKQKAAKLGVPYQTFISETLHHLAA
jgi:predicted DNA binding CopG/RHH family protein